MAMPLFEPRDQKYVIYRLISLVMALNNKYLLSWLTQLSIYSKKRYSY